MHDPDINRVISIAMEKQSLIEKFLHLTEEQAVNIKNDDYDMVLNIINRKQTIIEQINLLDLNYQSNTGESQESLRLINDKTLEIMSKAIVIDDENRLLLKKRQAQIFERLKKARQNRVTHTLYRGKNMNMEGTLLDQKK